jgi:hypothetical protein
MASRRHCVIQVKNTDSLCLPRSLVVAIALDELKSNKNGMTKNKYRSIRLGRGIQQDLAEELCIMSDVQINSRGAGIEELLKFQFYLKDRYSIRVYHANSPEKNHFFKGKADDGVTNYLNILYDGRHYYTATSMSAYFGCDRFCNECCKKFYKIREYEMHQCESKCKSCKSANICGNDERLITCAECLRKFNGQACFERHLEKIYDKGKNSLCDNLKRCKFCLNIIPPSRTGKHVCGEVFCNVCKEFKDSNHLCYVQPYKCKSVGNFIYFFYDLECMQSKQYDGKEDVFEHTPNICITYQACFSCISEEPYNPFNKCEVCGDRVHVFLEDPVKEFLELLRSPQYQENFRSIKVLAHNAKGYDSQHVLKRCVEDYKWAPELITNGLQILQMKIPFTNISFIDSLAFMPLPLSGLPKAFGFSETVKGYFPHFFNTPENQNYIGPYPDKEMYGFSTMTNDQQREFLKWYLNVKDSTFNFKEEILKYCHNDVEILAKACIKFRQEFVTANCVDPFQESITIAGAALAVFKKCFLKENQIGIIPRGGYRLADTQSRIAIEWLVYEEKMRGVTIQHAGRGREFKVPGVGKVSFSIWNFAHI